MTGIGIYPGDWLIVEQINPLFNRPKEGDIVIVSVNDEIMVKRYQQKDGKVILLSENDNHKPIVVSDESIYVTGVVRNAIRRNLSRL